MKIADLLPVAARVLDQTGDLPPATVTCSTAERFLPPLVHTLASLGMSEEDRTALVTAVASAPGWAGPGGACAENDGWTSTGTVDGLDVQAIAVPLPGCTSEPLTRPYPASPPVSTLSCYAPFVDWSASLPAEVKSLEVAKDCAGPAGSRPVWCCAPGRTSGASPSWSCRSPTMGGAATAASACCRPGTSSASALGCDGETVSRSPPARSHTTKKTTVEQHFLLINAAASQRRFDRRAARVERLVDQMRTIINPAMNNQP